MILLKNRISELLKSKSGVSLIFVLGIMMMLFAIGGAVISSTGANVEIGSSVMGSATANFGSNIRQNQYNTAILLSESIHRTIKQSLLTPGTNFDSSLAKYIPQLLFANRDEDFKDGFPLQLGGAIAPVITPLNPTITLKFPFPSANPSITYQDPIPAMPELGIERVPATGTLSAKVVIEVVVDLPGIGNRSITTLATYEYTGGVFSDATSYVPPATGAPDLPGVLQFTEFGTWKLVSYEITETN